MKKKTKNKARYKPKKKDFELYNENDIKHNDDYLPFAISEWQKFNRA